MLWCLSAVIRRSFFRQAAELSRSCTTWLDAVLMSEGNKKEDQLGDKLRDKLGDKRTHRPTEGNKKEGKLGDKGDKETRLRKVDAPSNKAKQDERQAGRQGDKAGGHTIQQSETRGEARRETRWETRFGDKLWRQALETRETRPREARTHHPTKGIKKGDKLGSKEKKVSGRRTHHRTKGNKKKDKLGNKGGTSGETSGDKLGGKLGDNSWETGRQGRQGRQGLGNADKPSNNRWPQEGRQAETSGETSKLGDRETRETRPRECGQAVQQQMATRRKTS
ncbi:unnamed protein product [Cladocopium goreaui]|uniref:Uncharacterized protein n=1 Tax=Cladocopium goreaui TaxID=2562237 RepID=A0A9P1FH95_9DINO|nr:unnamed protein product [Cladocopium goreaui]